MIKFLIVFIIFPGLLFSKDLFLYKLQSTKINDEVAIKNVKYIEKREFYDNFFTPEKLKILKECYLKNKKWLKKAEKLYNVDPNIIVSILTVESLCGKYHEKYNIVEVYKTLNFLKKNKKYQKKIFQIVKKKYPKTSKKWFIKRINKKSKWAKVQLKALEKMYKFYNIDVFKIKGSWAGAFGLPQFIPTTFLHYAVDGNNDGKIDLTQFSDAILSIANYLKRNGWKEKLSYNKKIKVILRYNYSKLYAITILKLSEKI